MTRNEPPGAALYDADFYSWTQTEAAALRALPPGGPTAHLDIAHLAEEIADLGKRDLREVTSYLVLVVQHLIKLDAVSASRDAAHWHAEAANFQGAARRTFSPGLRRLLDIDDIWTSGCRAAGRFLRDRGAGNPPPTCPFTLDDLLAPDFDVETLVARVALRR